MEPPIDPYENRLMTTTMAKSTAKLAQHSQSADSVEVLLMLQLPEIRTIHSHPGLPYRKDAMVFRA